MQVDVCDLKQACFELDMWAEGTCDGAGMWQKRYGERGMWTKEIYEQEGHVARRDICTGRACDGRDI